MLKMKSALCIVAFFSLALVSCVERLAETEMPNVDNGAVTMVKAIVKPLTLEGVAGQGLYKWDGLNAIGINGTSKGVNERYLPVQSTIGGNEAYFYGNEVAGDLTIYMPYSQEGGVRADEGYVVVPVEQQYYNNPFDHLMYNSTLLATTSGNEVEFGFYAGLVEVAIRYDIQDIASVKMLVGNLKEGYNNHFAGELSIVDGMLNESKPLSNMVAVSGFGDGVNSSKEVGQELKVWLAVAPGTYQNFVFEITDKNNVTISAPVEGPFVVSRCSVVSCVAEKIDHDNGIGDMEGENGDFNEGK